MKSLRARLLWSVSLATLAVWGIAVVASYYGTRHEAIEFLDGQLAQSARLLLSRVRQPMPAGDSAKADGGDAGLVEFLEASPLHGYEQPLEFQVWALGDDGAGRLLLRSPRVPALGLNARLGYADITHEGRAWRVYTQRDTSGRFQVQVAQPSGKRTRAALEVAGRVLVPFLIALPLLMLTLLLAVGRGLGPVDRLARDVALRAPDALDPLPTEGMPRETQPLLAALNSLLARLGRALENERRFTADAAHELRTPLAALQVQAQVARLATDEATRAHAIDQVLAGVARATHLVEQLLRLARLDPMGRVTAAGPCALAGLLDRVAEPLRPLAAHKEIDIAMRVPGDMAIQADGDLLGLALRNLLENALRYLPRGGHVALGAEESADGTRVWVRDDGPGVEEEDLARLTERFYRGRNVTEEGSGLGLAIARRVAQLHGGELHLENLAGGGFQATLALPPTLSVR